MHFFERQKVDIIGQVGVSLQKILLFFMVLSAFSLFNGGLLSFLICLVGFIGAVKRNPRLLATYYSVTIFFIMLFFFLSLASMATYNNDVQYDSEYYSESFSSSSSSSEDVTAAPTAGPTSLPFSSTASPKTHSYTAPAQPKHIWRGIMRAAGASAPAQGPANTTESSSVSWDSQEYYPESHEVEWNTLNISIAVVAIFFYFFMSYLKIKSLVLAYRMRKLILLAAILPEFFHDDCESPKQESEPAPAPVQPVSNKCVDDDEEPSSPAPVPQQTYFTQPGFMPYAPVPMQYPGGPSMVPPPMMYGQYPVYYSFAPASPNQSEDKL